MHGCEMTGDTYVNDVAADYPGYFPYSIMRDFRHYPFGDIRTVRYTGWYLPDGRYAKKVFIATMHYGHVFRFSARMSGVRILGSI